MHFDTEGTYTLQYTATDSCGNETIEERTVEVFGYSTVLYADGTFIINEKSTDRAANEALHGAATNIYDPFDPNGDTDAKKYIFDRDSSRPWNGQASSVMSVEIGANILPTSTNKWFRDFINCTSIDMALLDTSAVTDMGFMFHGCRSLTSLDLSTFDTSAVTSMQSMFNSCRSLTSLDLSAFDTSATTIMSNMFIFCNGLTRIYASANFVVNQVTASTDMFNGQITNLVGGAGTTWSSANPMDKTYAHIDGGTADPGYFTAKA